MLRLHTKLLKIAAKNVHCLPKTCLWCGKLSSNYDLIKVRNVFKVQNASKKYVYNQQRYFSKGRKLEKKEVPKDEKAVPVGIKQPKINEIKRLMQIASSENLRIAGAICFLVVSSGVTLAVPYCMGKVIDIINTAAHDGTLMEKLNSFCSMLLIVFVIGGLANFGRVYLMSIAEERIIMKIRSMLFSSIMKQEVSFFDKTKTGELISRLSSDTSMVGNCVTFNISDGLRSLAQAGGSIGMMVYVSPKLTLIALGIVPPVAILSIYYGRYIKSLTKRTQESLADATAVAEERMSNIRTVRAFVKEKVEVGKYNEALQKVLDLAYKEALASGIFWGGTGLSGNLIVLSVFYAGGMMMNESLLTIGDLSAFLLYAAYIGVSLSGMSSFYSEIMKGLGASTRIFELTYRQPLIPISGGLVPEKPVVGEIVLDNVSFTYPSRPDAPILSDLSIHMPAGSVTAFVGSSGSGKSTIGNMLLRFYDPSSGKIMLDGYDIKDLDPSWLRENIAVVSQEPTLFACSIADNIRYGASDPSAVTMDMIEEAASKANALMFIRRFPEQFDTLVGERGMMLSGGQRQRIAIARAILKNPKILLLDEATSALDAESEYYVKEALDRMMVGRTVITIAHRLSTIRSANQIAVLDSGRVAELGTYKELMRIQDGIFQKLVERQTITS